MVLRLTVQPDWEECYIKNDKYIWFHEYSDAGTNYYKLERREFELFSNCDKYECNLLSSKLMQLYLKNGQLEKTFQSADFLINLIPVEDRIPKCHMSCFDVSPNGNLMLCAFSDYTLSLRETNSGEIRIDIRTFDALIDTDKETIKGIVCILTDKEVMNCDRNNDQPLGDIKMFIVACILRTMEGHVGQIYTCSFFPSGLAALTGGADMNLKIWCLKTGICAATLAPKLAGSVSGSNSIEPGGHVAAILDTGIIDRGRNIVAIDRLGWLRLWDVSTQICLSAIPVTPSASNFQKSSTVFEEITCLALKEHQSPLNSNEDSFSEPWFKPLETTSDIATEVGTSDTLMAVGTGVGACVRLYELGARYKGCVFQCTLPSATGSIKSISFANNSSMLNTDSRHNSSEINLSTFSEFGLFAGGQNGELVSWDLRQTKQPLWEFSGDKGAVDHLRVLRYPNDPYYCLIVGQSDGRVVIYPYNPQATENQINKASLELTGINCEPIRGLSIKPTSKTLWTTSYSGVLRCYEYIETHQTFGHI